MPRRHHYRVPKYVPGQLTITYGIAEKRDNPDIVYTGLTCDGHFLHSVMGHKRLGLEFPSGNTIEEPSLFDELKARGYDLTTVKFSIWKTGMKPQPKRQEPKTTFTIFWKNGTREVFQGHGANLKEAFEFEKRIEDVDTIFHWELGNNRRFVWDATERRWSENHRAVPSWETK